jgi:dolichol kinase
LSKSVADPTALGLPARSLSDSPPKASPARPENASRSLFHVASALFALLLLRTMPGRGWLIAASGTLCAMAWVCEISRRIRPEINERMMRFFSRIAHPQERHRVNSSTWYLTALVGLSIFAPLPSAEVAVVVLGLADPAAGFIGRRIGRTKLLQNRSLEGTLGFFAVGTLAALATLALFHVMTLPAMLLVAAVAAAAGAVAELASSRLDDNFTIPVTVAAAATLAATFAPVA